MAEKIDRKKLRKDFNSFVKHTFLIEYVTPQLRLMLLNENLKHYQRVMINRMLERTSIGHTPDGYNTHHITPLFFGGSNAFENLILIPKGNHYNLHGTVEHYGIDKHFPLKANYFKDIHVILQDGKHIKNLGNQSRSPKFSYFGKWHEKYVN